MSEQARNAVRSQINPDSIAKAENLVVPATVMSSLQATQKIRTPWFDTFLTLDPRESLSKIKCPVLAINGDKDTQVEAEPNLAIIKERVQKAEIRKMPSLNHCMQHADTGDLSEYSEIKETISPDVLQIILDFIRNL